MRYFMQNVAIHELGSISGEITLDATELIDNRIKVYMESVDAESANFSEDLSGIEYEHYCSALFTKEGWQSSVTKATGDQGADLVISKDNLRGVIQCKRYEGQIGNSAVQEVYSAKGFYEADFAAVVTNSSFTPSAKILAYKLGVVLLHHGDISVLSNLSKTNTFLQVKPQE